MKCFKKKQSSVRRLSPSTYIAIHVQNESLRISCKNHPVKEVKEDINIGALRIQSHCKCNITLHDEVVGRTDGAECEGHETVKMDVLLPGICSTYKR